MSPPRLDAVRNSLKTVETSEPRLIRHQALDAIQRLSGAAEATFFRYHLASGSRYYAAPQCTTPEATAIYEPLEGFTAFLGPHDHLRPKTPELNRFVDHRTFLTNPWPLPDDHPIQRYTYGPLGVLDEQRLLCFDGPRFVGHVSTHFHKLGQVTTENTANLNRLIPEIIALLVRADRIERSELQPSEHFIVLPTGTVQFATNSAEAWLNPRRRERIEDMVRRADRKQSFDSMQIVDGARATLVRMHGASVIYLVSLEATTAPELSPDHLLTPRQREIAEYAVAGATAREIAQTMHLSFETVRDHLKEIYRRLHVASRAELVNALMRVRHPG